MTYIYIYIYTDTDPITLPCSLARAGNKFSVVGIVFLIFGMKGFEYFTTNISGYIWFIVGMRQRKATVSGHSEF